MSQMGALREEAHMGINGLLHHATAGEQGHEVLHSTGNQKPKSCTSSGHNQILKSTWQEYDTLWQALKMVLPDPFIWGKRVFLKWPRDHTDDSQSTGAIWFKSPGPHPRMPEGQVLPGIEQASNSMLGMCSNHYTAPYTRSQKALPPCHTPTRRLLVHMHQETNSRRFKAAIVSNSSKLETPQVPKDKG